MKKIAFFDIDGTLTSEIDGSIPESAVYAIRAARANGNLMFINTGRCFQNVEQRFRDVGFDGFVCGCGTDIYCDGAEILHVAQTHETVMKLLLAAREWDIDILFESRKEVAFDLARPLRHPDARRQYEAFEERGYEMPEHLENPNFSVISLSYGLSTPSSLPVSVPQATAILSALTGAAISANSFRSATPKPPVLTMCLIITG